MDTQDVIHWLQEGEEWAAADLLAQCDFNYYYIDSGFAISGGPDIDIVGLDIQAPRRILDRLSEELHEHSDLVEKAVRTVAEAQHCYIRDIIWVAKVGTIPSPSDSEIEYTLQNLDSEHIRSAWNKALSRRATDPDGAITSAKTLVEAVCKHILNALSVQYPPNQDIISLYHLVAERLNISPSQHIDKNLKRILGSCQAVVTGIAFLRNHLGDAHSKEPGGAVPTRAEAELAVNLAGAMATFLVKTWEDHKGTERGVGADR
ncbi:MAG: abortive infection family protein [Proteobacteria bacterium]|nr:abortive infection family protein [Pseudomonadota bacterium]